MSKTGYIEYVPGDAPLIISAPHGGLLEPAHIPDRSGVVDHDAHTVELARLYAEAFFELTGERPHLVINHLHRRKLDANRDLAEAAEGHPDAEEAWREFHAYIDEAKARAVDLHGWSLYVDLHGQSHAHQRVELGYGIGADDLRLPDDALNTQQLAARSTLRPWCLPGGEGDSGWLASLLRGPESLGALLERYGAPSVPSDREPFPRSDWAYFSGGYNVKRHGARDGGPVGAVQIEVNSNWRRTRASRLAFARILARATADFLAGHAGGAACGAQIQVRTVDASGRRGVLAGAALTGVTRLEFEATELSLREVNIELDGTAIYRGEGLPEGIALDPAAMPGGMHSLRVAALDEHGETREYEAVFLVRHFRFQAPWHGGPFDTVAKVAGTVRLAVESDMAAGSLGEVQLLLVPVVSTAGDAIALGSSAAWPFVLDVDTRRFRDGVYDLIVTAETARGARSEHVERIEIDNWNVLEDALLPPSVGGWIGTVDLLKSVQRSDGWVHATDRPEEFSGDAHRLKARPGGSEFLVWKLDHLRSFEIVLYAAGLAVEDHLAVAVSTDGEHWTDLEYSVEVAEAPGPADPGSARRIVATGSVPAELRASYLRLSVRAGEPEALLQLGNVRLVGASERLAKAE